jgi:hypothetical protein
MDKSRLPDTLPKPERTLEMLNEVPIEFTFREAWDEVKGLAIYSHPPFLRQDLKKLADAGILRETEDGWRKVESDGSSSSGLQASAPLAFNVRKPPFNQ